MKLNLNYEDLAAVISLCLSMGRIDNDFTSKELEAIANGVLKEYDFSGKEELFQQYFDDANEMDFDDVIRHISQFGDNEKQFVADMLNATMRADDKITTDEASLYQMCVSAFCLPLPAEPVKVKTSDPNIVIPGFLCYDYTLWSNEFTDGIAFVHQAPVGVNFHNWMFECCGTKTFTKWEDTKILKILTEKLHYDDGRKLIMLQAQREHTKTPNKVAYVLSGGTNITDSIEICFKTRDGHFEGFTYKSDLIWLVNAIDTIFEGKSLIDGSGMSRYLNKNKQNLESAINRINELKLA